MTEPKDPLLVIEQLWQSNRRWKAVVCVANVIDVKSAIPEQLA